WVPFNRQGLHGILVIENEAGIASAGDDPVKLILTRLKASFLQRQLFGEGKVDLFGGKYNCDITQINLLDRQAQATINCPEDASVSLEGDSAKLRLLLQDFTGTVGYQAGSNT